MNNQKIIMQLQSGGQEKAFARLYNFYPKIERHVKINSGSKDEALDIFQEALIILYKKVKTLETDSSIQVDGFLVNTCKLLWSNELRKKKVRQKSGDEGLEYLAYQDEIHSFIEKEVKLNAVEEIIKNLGDRCKGILEAFYYKNFSMEKIADQFGFKTIQSAKVQKYKCMEAARKMAIEANQTWETADMAGYEVNLKTDQT
jgi:RNA polymerase sigma factor (sigma-70 family)